jgi:hypothetical protein
MNGWKPACGTLTKVMWGRAVWPRLLVDGEWIGIQGLPFSWGAYLRGRVSGNMIGLQ